MIHWMIEHSIRNRLLILLLSLGLFGWGLYSVQSNKIDAIPDLSENQVIVFTEWMGKSPELIENQVTYPLVTNLQGLPRVKYVRGSSMFGMSFIYVIFEDEVDVYWARERVMERLATASNSLPEGVRPTLGPDGTGVGHILWYTLDAPGMDLGEQRALQDWYVKFGLQNVAGVSEIASFGGFQKQYEINIDPNKLVYYNLSLGDIMRSVRSNNGAAGGSKIEMNDIGYIIKTDAYLGSLQDIEAITVKTENGNPIRIRDLARVQMTGASRLGIFDLDGKGETVGGIVVMRYGENAVEVIERVKKQMEELAKGLPQGVKFNIVYDRSGLIQDAVSSIRNTLLEEMLAASLVVMLFLFHWRSAFIILIQLPLSVSLGFILLNAFGISSNIMSLTGIALSIGVIVDDAIVMVENAYRLLAAENPALLDKERRLAVIIKAAKQVGPSVFWSTIIVIASFLPVFLLSGQEGKLFSPLAWTKTFILLIDAVIAICLTPILIYFFLRGKLKPENANPLNRWLEAIYGPVLKWCLKWRKTTIGINILALIIAIPMLFRLGTEFMPPLDEQSILFMPVTLPDISNEEAKRILQIQDQLIKSVPEVDKVLGKAGRAATATDNAPVSMIETIILLKPHAEWREGISKQDIITELDQKLQIPGVVNGWTQPIINRINMLATGIRTDIGIKVYGPRLDSIEAVSARIRNVLEGTPGLKDLYVEPLSGGKYIAIDPIREQLARYDLNMDELNLAIETALGGTPFSTTVEGRQRFGISLRLGQDYRNSLEKLRQIPLKTSSNGWVTLGQIAEVKLEDGAPMINSENALLRGAVLFNVRERDPGSTVKEAMEKVDAAGLLPPGYFLEWSGQWENQARAQRTLLIILPIVLLIILLILYFSLKSFKEALLNLVTIPFALIGGVYVLYFFEVNLSVAVAVGFIALFGLAIETAMVMVVYLNDSMRELVALKGTDITENDIRDYVYKGAVKRLRPKIMTVSVSLFGLIPVLWSTGVGTDVMLPIVIPMIGGVFTSSIHILLVTPVVFEMTKILELRKHGKIEIYDAQH